jgi:hypothetical protein
MLSLSLAFSCFLSLLSSNTLTLLLLPYLLLTLLLSNLLIIQLIRVPKLCYLYFLKFFCLLVLLFSLLI